MVAALVFSLSIFNNGFKKSMFSVYVLGCLHSFIIDHWFIPFFHEMISYHALFLHIHSTSIGSIYFNLDLCQERFCSFLLVITDACMHLCDSPSKMTVSKSEIFLGSSDEDEVDDMYQQDLDMQVCKMKCLKGNIIISREWESSKKEKWRKVNNERKVNVEEKILWIILRWIGVKQRIVAMTKTDIISRFFISTIWNSEKQKMRKIGKLNMFIQIGKFSLIIKRNHSKRIAF